MADAANKYPENVEGKFYVDDQCIDCDLCRETAPANFRRNDDWWTFLRIQATGIA
jgi:ferredoxin